MCGWHPAAGDDRKYSGLARGGLEAAWRADETKLANLGCEARLAFIHTSETGAADLRALLAEDTFDVVLIGAGVRRDDDHFLVFEQLVNVVHEHAPRARIAFNTGPTDTAAAVQRWLDA